MFHQIDLWRKRGSAAADVIGRLPRREYCVVDEALLKLSIMNHFLWIRK